MMLDGRRNWSGRLRGGSQDVEGGRLRMGKKSGILREQRDIRRTTRRSGLYGLWSGIWSVSWDLSMIHNHKHSNA
jgi:hypothetical protein